MSLPLMHSKELNKQYGRDTPDPNGGKVRRVSKG